MTEAHWRVIFEEVGVGMALLDLDGNLLETNRSFQEMIGYAAQELRGKNWKEVTHPEDIAVEEVRVKEFVEGKEIDLGLEKRYLRKDGNIVWASINITLLRNSKGIPQFVLAVIQNITERKVAEEQFRMIFEGVGIGMALVGLDGNLLETNRSFQEMIGYTAQELREKNWKEITHPDSILEEQESLKRLVRGEKVDQSFEKRYVGKDGSVVWANLTLTLVRDWRGELQFGITAIQDITKRKLTDEKLLDYQEQLQSLASKLSLTEERERRRIATDIHDHVTQSLSLAMMRLKALRESASSSDSFRELDYISGLIEDSIQNARSLISELSPPVLYELGFEAALEWLADRMREQHGISVVLKDDGQTKPLDHDVQGVIFRAVGELMVNISKHAQARNAAIAVLRKGTNLRVEVEDDGVGFDTLKINRRDYRKESFGLFSIRERLELLGGSLEIESQTGQGTRAILTAPLKL